MAGGLRTLTVETVMQAGRSNQAHQMPLTESLARTMAQPSAAPSVEPPSVEPPVATKAAPAPHSEPAPRAAVEQPQPMAAPQPMASEPLAAPGPMAENAARPALPTDFGIDKEHPLLSIPFNVFIDGRSYTGQAISVTQMVLRADAEGTLGQGSRHVACVYLRYSNFGISLEPEVVVLQESPDGEVVVQFTDPTGDPLPQLRYLINSYIAGDIVSLNGMLAYTGPTAPKTPKAAASPEQGRKERIKSLSVLALSAVIAVVAAVVVFTRYTTGHEMHPVFVDRAGQQLRATVGGQVGFVNPQAGQGEVVFSVNSNTGDVLNFQMPCDCELDLQPGISAGSTVLPADLIATVYAGDAGLAVNTMMSVSGLGRAMQGDNLWLDFADGRSVQVKAVPTAATRAATLAGDLFLPVNLRAVEDGALTAADIGTPARLRITPNLLNRIGIN